MSVVIWFSAHKVEGYGRTDWYVREPCHQCLGFDHEQGERLLHMEAVIDHCVFCQGALWVNYYGPATWAVSSQEAIEMVTRANRFLKSGRNQIEMKALDVTLWRLLISPYNTINPYTLSEEELINIEVMCHGFANWR